jgi:succinate-semialdehyde dehydrogenase/glutarate-semialdehyde dehydrogenase
MSTITASQEEHAIASVPKQLYIAGEWRDGAQGTLAVEDPSTGQTLCDVADASAQDACAARLSSSPSGSMTWP